MLRVVKMIKTAANRAMPVADHACRRALAAHIPSSIAERSSSGPTNKRGGSAEANRSNHRCRNDLPLPKPLGKTFSLKGRNGFYRNSHEKILTFSKRCLFRGPEGAFQRG